jgi:hypothetical protein
MLHNLQITMLHNAVQSNKLTAICCAAAQFGDLDTLQYIAQTPALLNALTPAYQQAVVLTVRDWLAEQ